MTEWDDYAAGWDESAEVRAYAAGAFQSLVSLAESTGFDLTGSTACDFGCGTGLLTERLTDVCAHIDAVDTSAAMLDVLGAKIDHHRWRHVRLLDRLPSEPQGYALIVCSSVLAFVDDYPVTIDDLVRHLSPGGLFVQWDWEFDPSDEEPYGFTRAQIRTTLTDAGLADVGVDIGFEVAVEGGIMRPLMGVGRRAA
jgi:predicted TPR repeat methyltransferase